MFCQATTLLHEAATESSTHTEPTKRGGRLSFIDGKAVHLTDRNVAGTKTQSAADSLIDELAGKMKNSQAIQPADELMPAIQPATVAAALAIPLFVWIIGGPVLHLNR